MTQPWNVRLAVLALPLSLLLSAGAAPAQEQVKIHFQVPAGHAGFAVTGVTLLESAAVVGELDVPITVSGGFSSISFAVSASDVPDEVEVAFAVPSGGTATLYIVAGVDFAFDQMYFLPDPSPGGIIGPQPGDASADAFFELSLVTPTLPTDLTSPTCTIAETSPGVLAATLQDLQSGLTSIAVQFASNLVVSLPAFVPGTTDPVTVVASVVNSRRSATLLLKAVDAAGNAVFCKKIVSRVRTMRTPSARR